MFAILTSKESTMTTILGIVGKNGILIATDSLCSSPHAQTPGVQKVRQVASDALVGISGQHASLGLPLVDAVIDKLGLSPQESFPINRFCKELCEYLQENVGVWGDGSPCKFLAAGYKAVGGFAPAPILLRIEDAGVTDKPYFRVLEEPAGFGKIGVEHIVGYYQQAMNCSFADLMLNDLDRIAAFLLAETTLVSGSVDRPFYAYHVFPDRPIEGPTDLDRSEVAQDVADLQEALRKLLISKLKIPRS